MAIRNQRFAAKGRYIFIALPILLIVSAVSATAVRFNQSDLPFFDSGTNGLWTGYQWLTGKNVRTGLPVSTDEAEKFLRLIEDEGIRYVFVRAGPILSSGGIVHLPGNYFYELQKRSPDALFLPWLTGDSEELDLSSSVWRRSFIGHLQELRDQGIPGIHLNIEPVLDNDSSYIILLREIRAALGDSFFLSHATKPTGTWTKSLGLEKDRLWSEGFYKATMGYTDQSVLMAYNTRLNHELPYSMFVGRQTNLLVKWGCVLPDHHILIGIPAYEHAPHHSDPDTENIRIAARGVRSALNRSEENIECFDGVSVYANWMTDPGEWDDFHSYWRGDPTTTVGEGIKNFVAMDSDN